jgi:hypothetical protein
LVVGKRLEWAMMQDARNKVDRERGQIFILDNSFSPQSSVHGPT